MAREAFVRESMIAPVAAPVYDRNIVGWARKNLFNGWLNSILTILFIMAVYLGLAEFLPWAIRSSWTANSLHECRDAIKAAYGEDVHGACWAVIRERYLQMFYGFYPKEFYWRPNLTFICMLVAISPVLFPELPRKLLYFTFIYPALGYWLLWGGNFWAPVTIMIGIVLGYMAISVLTSRFNAIVGVVSGILLVVIWLMFLIGPISSALYAVVPFGLEPVESADFGGFMLSIIIGVSGIAASLPLGIILALGRKSDMLFVKSMCVGFIEFIRGVPLITLLFVASVLLNLFLPPGTSFDIILRVVVMVTLFSAAYMAEVIRGGLAGLHKGQYEAADALGFDYWKSMRLIILPQALKISIPGIVSTFIGLFKDTTLVSIIGLLDPIGLSTAIRADANWHGIVWELYVFVAAIFFIFCFSMSRYSMYLERKLATDHR